MRAQSRARERDREIRSTPSPLRARIYATSPGNIVVRRGHVANGCERRAPESGCARLLSKRALARASRTPLPLKPRVDWAARQAVAKPVDSDDDVMNIATIATGSEGMGRTIASCFKRVGSNGATMVEDGQVRPSRP